MAQTLGRDGAVFVAATDTVADAAYTEVGECYAISYSTAHGTVDATTFDSDGAKASDYGETEATFSFTFREDFSDSGQDIVRAADEGKLKLYVRYLPYVNSGDPEKKFTMKINSLSISNAREEKIEQVCEGVSDGAITTQNQA